MTTTPLAYVPQPYPVEYAGQFWRDRTEKKPILLVAGVTDRPNIALGQTVARKLQVKFPQFAIHVTDTPGHQQDLSNLSGAKFNIQPFLPWTKQLAYLSEVMLVINTDFTQTRGRVQTDCAAVGTPSIGADSDAQVDLYPQFPANEHTSIDELIAQGEKLITNTEIYERIAQDAKSALSKYTYSTSKNRLISLINQFPKKS